MLVFYVVFSGADAPYAIACKGFVEDPLLPDSVRLGGIEDLEESRFPDLKIEEIVVRKCDITHYVKGAIKPKLKVVEDPPLQMSANSRPPPPPNV